jgi:uncharacterized protein (DUF362 family)
MRNLWVLGCIAALVGCRSAKKGEGATAAAEGTSASASASTHAASSGSGPSGIDVESHASAAWEAGAPVVAKGTVDGAKLRERTRARLASDESNVVIVEGESARAVGTKICEATVPKRPASTPILLKPNLGGFDWFKDPKASGGDDGLRGRITDPEFVRGVIRCLKARGHTRITVAEGWGATHADWERLIKASGYQAMTADEGVPLVAMDDDGTFDVEGDKPGQPLAISGMEATHVPNLMMPKVLAEHLDHGLFISLPKAKAHRFAVFSAGIKGAQGVVMTNDATPAFRQKWRMHKELNPWLAARKKGGADDRAGYVAALEAFADRMADVTAIAAPHVVLVDASPAMGGDGFQRMVPLNGAEERALAIGGTHVVRVDRVVAELLGLWDEAGLARELGGHRTSPLLERAAKAFGVEIGAAKVDEKSAAILARPRAMDFKAMAPFSLHRDAGGAKSEASAAAPSEAMDAGAADARGSAVTSGDGEARPTAQAAKLLAGERLTIDGKGDEAAWSRATAVSFSSDWSGKETGVVTTVRWLWDASGLYGMWELSSAGLNADATRAKDVDRPKLYEEDCVEVFVGESLAAPERYFEIEVGPFGQFLDLRVDRGAKVSEVAWSSGPEIATVADPVGHRATIEFALRGSDVRKLLKSGGELPFAMYRMEGKSPRLYLAWSPTRTPKPNFHVPKAFGRLRLEP